MSGRRASSKESRDLGLSEPEEKVIEEPRQHFKHEMDRVDDNMKRAEYAKLYNKSSLLLNLSTEALCMIIELAASAHQPPTDDDEGDDEGDDEPDDDEDPEDDERSLLPEVVMSQVCTHLRDVALNHPALWTRFYFSAGNVKSSISNSLTRFDTYIKRSRSENLELFLSFGCQSQASADRAPIKEQSKVLDMALKHISRWKICTLISDGELQIEKVCPALLVASAPNLEYFSYLPWSYDASDEWTSESDGINSLNPGLLRGGTPKLRYLLMDVTSIKIPAFTTITTLRIESDDDHPPTRFSWESFLAILSLPLLTNFSMAGSIFVDPDNNHVPIVTMNNLKHLRYSDTPSMTQILPFLRAPLLETLLIHGINRGSKIEFDFNGPSESYFFPSLQNLAFLDTALSPDLAWRVVQLTSNIDRLILSRSYEFLIYLSDSGPFNQCWPKLSGITVEGSCRDPIGRLGRDKKQFQSFCDFVLSRPRFTPGLRLSKELHDEWNSKFAAPYGVVQERCTVELVVGSETEMLLMQPFYLWPPGVYFPEYALRKDPFRLENRI